MPVGGDLPGLAIGYLGEHAVTAQRWIPGSSRHNNCGSEDEAESGCESRPGHRHRATTGQGKRVTVVERRGGRRSAGATGLVMLFRHSSTSGSGHLEPTRERDAYALGEELGGARARPAACSADRDNSPSFDEPTRGSSGARVPGDAVDAVAFAGGAFCPLARNGVNPLCRAFARRAAPRVTIMLGTSVAASSTAMAARGLSDSEGHPRELVVNAAARAAIGEMSLSPVARRGQIMLPAGAPAHPPGRERREPPARRGGARDHGSTVMRAHKNAHRHHRPFASRRCRASAAARRNVIRTGRAQPRLIQEIIQLMDSRRAASPSAMWRDLYAAAGRLAAIPSRPPPSTPSRVRLARFRPSPRGRVDRGHRRGRRGCVAGLAIRGHGARRQSGRDRAIAKTFGRSDQMTAVPEDDDAGGRGTHRWWAAAHGARRREPRRPPGGRRLIGGWHGASPILRHGGVPDCWYGGVPNAGVFRERDARETQRSRRGVDSDADCVVMGVGSGPSRRRADAAATASRRADRRTLTGGQLPPDPAGFRAGGG
jgi:hypothetical protein